MKALEATFLLWQSDRKGCTQAAWAAFTNGIECLTAEQVVERLATDGIEISTDAAADLQRDCIDHGPNGVLAIWQQYNKHASAALDMGDGACIHQGILQQGGAA